MEQHSKVNAKLILYNLAHLVTKSHENFHNFDADWNLVWQSGQTILITTSTTHAIISN